MEDVYGIDLGTTHSCIAIIDQSGQPLVLQNREGEYTTPSVVHFDRNGTSIVGSAAKKMIGVRPVSTVAFIKREMSNNNYNRQIGQITITPIDISSLILKKLVDEANEKRAAEENRLPVTDVVITVPAYFGELERTRTIEAGKRAGLNVLRIINEPVAAALWYLHAQANGNNPLLNQTFLVYDLGGGTFDVCIIKVNNGTPEVLSVDGNHTLGGIDWDRMLANAALALAGIPDRIENIETTPEGGSLLLEAEKCKIILSSMDMVAMSFQYNGQVYTVDISRADFETVTSRLLDQTNELIQKVAKDAGLLNANGTINVDAILLVGGSSRMPMVTKMINNKYQKPPKLIDPDQAVAKGAAIQAKHLAQDATAPALIIDKGTRSYGLLITKNDGTEKISNLIFKNDTMKIHREFNSGTNTKFQTRINGQTSVRIAIYENVSMGQNIDVHYGTLVKEDIIQWTNPVPKGTPVNVILDRNDNGIIEITAVCQGSRIKLVIDNNR
jgi:molecular chaperone DnaK (HSP70)